MSPKANHIEAPDVSSRDGTFDHPEDDGLDTLSYLSEQPVSSTHRRKSLADSTSYPRLLSRRSLIALGIASIGVTAGIGVPLGTRGSFYPGTTVRGVDISEHTRESALSVLRDHFSSLEDVAVDYVFEEQTWQAGLADLGFTIDYEATLDEAYNHGRGDGVVDRYSNVLISTEERSFPVIYNRDDAQLNSFLEQVGTDIIGATRDARLYLSGNTIEILADRNGRKLDVEKAASDTVNAVESAERTTVVLNAVPVISSVTAADLEPVREQTQRLIAEPISVTRGDAVWTVNTDMLIDALVFPMEGEDPTPYLDPDRLSSGLQNIADEMYRPPQNAVVGWDGGPVAIENDIVGREVDLDQLSFDIINAASKTGRARSTGMPMNDLLADVRTDNLNELGITAFLAEGSSSFAGSSEARAENVRISAGHVTHTLIPPGGTCSFNDSVGPITLENGFVEGKIIRGDWIESDLGGGACQASTTVFRAALFAGLEFKEWYPHQFRLAFYEADGSPPGLDAAIYQPNSPDEWELDLTFVNPTDSWMLMEMTTQDATAVVSLYGSPTGYEVDISEPTVSDPIKPDPPEEREDPKLKKGEREKIQGETPGYNVSMQRTVKKEGEIVRQDEFYSPYQPQREIWIVGPGTKATPTETPTSNQSR